MKPSDHIPDSGKLVAAPTITILATDRPGQAGDSARVCSRCGENLDPQRRLCVILWNQCGFVYCGTCRERMGI